jgi:hypothetical protein
MVSFFGKLWSLFKEAGSTTLLRRLPMRNEVAAVATRVAFDLASAMRNLRQVTCVAAE